MCLCVGSTARAGRQSGSVGARLSGRPRCVLEVNRAEVEARSGARVPAVLQVFTALSSNTSVVNHKRNEHAPPDRAAVCVCVSGKT